MNNIDKEIPKVPLIPSVGIPHIPSKIDKRLQQIFFLSVWSLTNGLILGTALCSSSLILVKLAPIALPINWVAFPFNPLNANRDDQAQNINKITRAAIIAICNLIGIVTPILLFSCIFPVNPAQYSTALKVSLIAGQIASITTNLIVGRVMHSKEDPKTRLNFSRLVTSAHQSYSLFFLRLSGWIPKFTTRNTKNVDPIEIIRRQIPVLSEQNKYSAYMDRRLRKFILEDQELKELFAKCLLATKHILIDFPLLRESPSVGDPVIDEWGIESQTALYWSHTAYYVGEFLVKNPKFAQLLCAKFNASNIRDKKEILCYYKLI